MAGIEDRASSLRGLHDLLAARAPQVAPALLGAVLEHHSPQGLVSVRLTEVEAYDGPADPGSHARAGRTPRTQVMFGPPGHLYVYFSYGLHWCVNVVCGQQGTASAILLRAGEVVQGLELARRRRPAARADRDLARGPARLASALAIDGSLNGAALGGSVQLRPVAALTPGMVSAGPRVGVSGPGGDGVRYPWRFWLTGERTVSVYRPATTRSRTRSAVGQAGGKTNSVGIPPTTAKGPP